MTRVKNLRVLGDRFGERDFSAVRADAGSQRPENRDVALKLRIAPEMAYRVYDDFDEDIAKKQPDGSFIVSPTWPEDDWVYGFILSFGEYIEVLEPEYMREIIKTKALKTAEKYR